jgi:hypothetical protein
MNGSDRRIAGARAARAGMALVVVALVVLGSCSSLFHAAMGSMIDHETDKAAADAEREAAADSGGSAGAPAQTAPANIDPSVHRVVGAWENPAYNNEGRSARVGRSTKGSSPTPAPGSTSRAAAVARAPWP